MAHDLKLSEAAANAEADAIVGLCDGGTLKLYTGTKPATANTAVTTQTLLGTLTFANPAASGAAAAGVCTYDTLSPDVFADADGDVTWARALESDGETPVFDATVGESGCDITIDEATIAAGQAISAISGTYTAYRG